ncbi:eCIS core domain-containing protein [Nocardia amamiensis]|uniref:eCIS core domain-containing protein n=1 Tax=Nocardia amamiensis TaxID=404578 RepID=UPI0008370CC5|nr:DUF4157 domain-containing protein [Nocardia amamiensis]
MPSAKVATQAKEPSKKPPGHKPIQKKLAVGAAGDRFEREADQVAREAVHGHGADEAVAIPPTISSLGAQRAPLPPATRDKPQNSASRRAKPVQRKPAPSLPRIGADRPSGKRAQRDAVAGSAGATAPAGVETLIGRMQAGGGRALDGGARNLLESRLGHDFSSVRVHHDSGAASAAQALNARAFTVGRDVFFNTGEYRPHTLAGRELIAHELTHTVQQAGGGVRKKVQRAPTPGTGTTSPQQEEEQDQTAPTSTTFASTRLPGGGLDTSNVGKSRGMITLPVLGLPSVAGALKGTAGGLVTPVAAPGREVPAVGAPFTLGPVGERDDSKAHEVWTAYARTNFKAGVRAKLDQMLAGTPNVPQLTGTGNATPVYYLKFKNSGGHVFIGTLDELSDQDALLRPQWSRTGSPLQGRGATLDADHFLELQIGGNDAADNMWLLGSGYNRSVGSALKAHIERDLKTILVEVGSTSIPETERPTDVNEMKRVWTIRFSTVAAGSGFDTTQPDFWTQNQINTGAHLDHLKFMTEADLVAAGLRLENNGVQPTRVRIFPGPGGGAMRTVRLNAAEQVEGGTFLYPNIWVTGGAYFGGSTDQAETRLLRLDVVINKVAKGTKNPIAAKSGTIDVLRDPRMGIAGYLSRQSIINQFAYMDFAPLSPLAFTDLGVNAEGVLVGTGSVLSSKALFPGLSVPLVLYGDRIMMSFPVPADNLSLGPLTVTEAALSLGVGTPGLFIEGYAGFVVNGLGSGSLTAEIAEHGPQLSGAFNFDADFFTPAQVTATYDLATDTLTAGGTLGVEKGKIEGVDSGTVTVLVSRERLDFNGMINLGAPLAGTVVDVAYTHDEGLRIGANNIPLPFASLPAVQNATMSVAATRTPEGVWSFGGTGQAMLAAPGATGVIALRYLDGVVTMTAAGQVAKGPASGTLNFTATNAPLDEQGNPVEGPPTTTVTVWGRGMVTIRFGNVLMGTAGIELTRDNRVILSGIVALPPEFEVFPRRTFTKDLLHIEPPEFPIWGVSVAGVGVGVFAFVDARIAFEAYVGAGVIRDAAITAELDLDHPELATLHGHGESFVPAYAGLTLDVGGGLRARAAVAYAQGRVGLQGTLGIQADASAGLDIDWNPTSGLAVETRVATNVRPKFRLSANASVTIGVDLLVTDVSRTFGPWQRTLGEFGPNMELGVEFPVRWSEANGLDLSVDDIVVRQPTLDARGLMSSVFDELAG